MVRVFTGIGFRTDQRVTFKSFKMVRVLINRSFKPDLSTNLNGANLRKSETNYILLRQKNLYYYGLNMRHITNVNLTKFLLRLFVNTSYKLHINIKNNALNFPQVKKASAQQTYLGDNYCNKVSSLFSCLSNYLKTNTCFVGKSEMFFQMWSKKQRLISSQMSLPQFDLIRTDALYFC